VLFLFIQKRGEKMAISSNTLAEIQRKAANGVQLVKPTAEKQAAYDSFKAPKAPSVQAQSAPQAPGFDQAAYMQQMQSQVNAIYDQQKAAQLAQYYAQRDKAIGKVNQQKAEVAPQYQSARNQSDVVSAQNAQRLREMMASSGLQSSGENVTASTGLQNARQNSLNGLNLQEQQTMNDLERQISDLNDPASEQALIASLEAQRAQALFDSSMRADEIGYSRGRDAIGDSRYNNEFAYQQGRDSIGDKQWQQQFNYGQSIDNRNFNYQAGRDSIGDAQWLSQFKYGQSRDQVGDNQWQSQFDYGKTRDQVGDSQWQQQFNYNKQQDAINNARKGRSGGGGGSYGGYLKGNPITQLPTNPKQSKIMTERQYIDAFEQPAARQKGTARVLPGSTDYAKKMQQVMRDLYK